ncbi:FecCD family ABC transporter permease [Streptococcus parauberis]|uniref:FecCD family ABC transporter permease n=1 Tax=Streptococcus parauberis TaxID=1348 RepID=UPI000C1CAD0C|nr:iron ABC transporter permease [Streptococcus parauberis]PIO79083.1 Iron-uptake system permease protein FeuC [Streptococcus parauberis]POS67257.1 Iron-uptake system permease protein FeuC [Streptococcus parauberis]
MTKQKFAFSLAILISFLAFLFFLSLSIGDSQMSLLAVLKSLMGKADASTTFIISSIRLPRILAAIFGGASLAISGLLLQTLSKNPLADSGILGINAGAGLAIALVTVYAGEVPGLMTFLPLIVISSALLTVALVYWMSLSPTGRLKSQTLIITGVGLSLMLSSLMIAITGRVNPFKLDYIISWLSGQIIGDDWKSLSLVLPVMIILLALAFWHSYPLNILSFNEETATSLGLSLKKERLITLILSTSLAALSVLLLGNISFVGLICGHIASQFVGADHRLKLPFAALLGMIFLLLSDTLVRVFLVGTNIPTGIVISIIGAPYFLYLMSKSK